MAGADPGEAGKAASHLRDRRPGADAFAADVTDRASAEAAVAHVVSAFGSLDVLVDDAAHRTPDAPRFEGGVTAVDAGSRQALPRPGNSGPAP
ncbi:MULTISPECIES: SDR family NAD(P)-dependent oxidoreductase [unclassified Streptomyces]|uniref:SDR family NAD(P)-dependent oxidoreductase n=1 Tax=unclassified Streptomyces TaxID=2593676 RepID=UPI0036FAA2CD